MTYRERREARAERRREWAEGRSQKADVASQAAHDATAGIPFGQPILVGHHSERRHRAAVDHGHRQMEKQVEHSQMASRHSQAADAIERQLDSSIYEDDTDAIERLRERIEKREARREKMKKRNAAYRKEHRAELKALTPYGREQAVPHPGWELSTLAVASAATKSASPVWNGRRQPEPAARAAPIGAALPTWRPVRSGGDQLAELVTAVTFMPLAY